MNSQFDTFNLTEGMSVIRCQMASAVDSDTNKELVHRGIGGVDYGVGATLEGDGAAKRSFDVLQQISRTGAYGVITYDGYDILTVGIATPPCAMFLDVPQEDNGEVITLKSFQFDRYAVVTEDTHPEIHDELVTHLSNYGMQQSLTTIEKSKRKRGIYQAVHQLEESGDLS